MFLERLLEIVAERGLTVKLRPDGTLVLVGPRHEATPPLLAALALFRDRIRERLQAAPSPETVP